MLWTLVQNNPSDTDNLYHLGVVYSELREFDKASATLEQLVELRIPSLSRLDGSGGCGDQLGQPAHCRRVASEGD